jgi:hypothetical protein
MPVVKLLLLHRQKTELHLESKLQGKTLVIAWSRFNLVTLHSEGIKETRYKQLVDHDL